MSTHTYIIVIFIAMFILLIIDKVKIGHHIPILIKALFPVLFLSAFLNEMPIVLIYLPTLRKISQKLGFSSTKLLMPLRFTAIMGGTFALIAFLYISICRKSDLRNYPDIIDSRNKSSKDFFWGCVLEDDFNEFYYYGGRSFVYPQKYGAFKMMDKMISAALKAGDAIMDIYNFDDFDVQQKEDSSPLTKADVASHNSIVDELQETKMPILSEEDANIEYSERSNWKTYWLIDPLDGTKEFIKRNGEFTVNIALIANGIPVAGVVYIPVQDKLLFAEHNKGAFVLENAKTTDISVAKLITACKVKSKELIAVSSKSHINDATLAYIEEFEKKGYSVECKSRGSSLKLCMVAEGLAHIYPRFGTTMEWDTAAAHAICREAGAAVIDATTGRELKYNKRKLRNSFFIVYTKAMEGIING